MGPLEGLGLDDIDWLIAGGESGARHRPVKAEWVRELRDRCRDEQVAFFFKQWGGVRAKAGGRVLDGRTWDQMPNRNTRNDSRVKRKARPWGFWTRAKLTVLRDYLAAFLTASSRQDERVYLDAFAGEGRGVDRVTGEEFSGSARIALEATASGGFTRFCFFEQVGKAGELEARLRAEFPGRAIKVYEGDCNETIPRALNDLREVRWAPTFGFIDPDGMEFAWETLACLAAHKRGYRSSGSTKREYKVEPWLLFPTQGLVR